MITSFYSGCCKQSVHISGWKRLSSDVFKFWDIAGTRASVRGGVSTQCARRERRARACTKSTERRRCRPTEPTYFVETPPSGRAAIFFPFSNETQYLRSNLRASKLTSIFTRDHGPVYRPI